ncbi:MAG: UDP-3-O-acyl-N-acetylglucosamine deacetylase [Planctomycetota bacterium]
MLRRISQRCQRTLARPATIRGTGFLTGRDISVRFLPSPAGSGIEFVRTDLPGRPSVPAHVSRVTGTARRTTLGGEQGVSLVEHVLAALAAHLVDNCVIEIDAPEPPGLDGSCQGFVELLAEAGTRTLPAPRYSYGVEKLVTVSAGNASLTLHPADSAELTITYMLDYGSSSPIPRQIHTHQFSTGEFIRRIAPCRTFLLSGEVDAFRSQGLGSKTSFKDLLVFGPSGVVGNRLRFGDEPARHKVLDILGDMALVGFDIAGHVVACRSGHPLNVALGRQLVSMAAAERPSSFIDRRFLRSA